VDDAPDEDALEFSFVWMSIAKTAFLDFVPGCGGC
jgi:hypothetical protein